MAAEQSQSVRPSPRLHTLNDGVHIPAGLYSPSRSDRLMHDTDIFPLEYRHIPGQAKDTDGAQSECHAYEE